MPLGHGQGKLSIGRVYPIELAYVAVRSAAKNPPHVRCCRNGVDRGTVWRGDGGYYIVHGRVQGLLSHAGTEGQIAEHA